MVLINIRAGLANANSANNGRLRGRSRRHPLVRRCVVLRKDFEFVFFCTTNAISDLGIRIQWLSVDDVLRISRRGLECTDLFSLTAKKI